MMKRRLRLPFYFVTVCDFIKPPAISGGFVNEHNMTKKLADFSINECTTGKTVLTCTRSVSRSYLS